VIARLRSRAPPAHAPLSDPRPGLEPALIRLLNYPEASDRSSIRCGFVDGRTNPAGLMRMITQGRMGHLYRRVTTARRLPRRSTARRIPLRGQLVSAAPNRSGTRGRIRSRLTAGR